MENNNEHEKLPAIEARKYAQGKFEEMLAKLSAETDVVGETSFDMDRLRSYYRPELQMLEEHSTQEYVQASDRHIADIQRTDIYRDAAYKRELDDSNRTIKGTKSSLGFEESNTVFPAVVNAMEALERETEDTKEASVILDRHHGKRGFSEPKYNVDPLIPGTLHMLGIEPSEYTQKIELALQEIQSVRAQLDHSAKVIDFETCIPGVRLTVSLDGFMDPSHIEQGPFRRVVSLDYTRP